MAELMPGGRSAGRIFRRFHARVVETVERLESGSWPTDGPLELEPVRAPMLEELARIEASLAEDPPADPAVARQILYLLAVYADDRAMAARWPGRQAWSAQRIESQLFGTALGASEVEARCRRMLTVPTPENRQLARLFLYAFGLGLGGGGGAADAERLAGLRRSLLDFARPARRQATSGHRRLFRQAYRYTAARGERRLLPDIRRWWLLAAALLVAVLLVSAFAWEGAVEGIREALMSPGGWQTPASAVEEQAPPLEPPATAEPEQDGEAEETPTADPEGSQGDA